MSRLSRLALPLLVLLVPAAARSQETSAWDGPIGEASARFGVPREWIRRVIEVESGGRTRQGGRPIRSRVGAMGLMQLMPRTWLSMRRAHGLGSDPDDPRDNILAGTAYLRAMFDLYGYPGLFAAYNAGPARYGDYLARGRPLPAETRAYLARVTRAPVSPTARVRDSRAVSMPASRPSGTTEDGAVLVAAGGASAIFFRLAPRLDDE